MTTEMPVDLDALKLGLGKEILLGTQPQPTDQDCIDAAESWCLENAACLRELAAVVQSTEQYLPDFKAACRHFMTSVLSAVTEGRPFVRELQPKYLAVVITLALCDAELFKHLLTLCQELGETLPPE